MDRLGQGLTALRDRYGSPPVSRLRAQLT